MKYAVIKIVNGSFVIDSEWGENLNGAIVKYHDVCHVLWNEATVKTAVVEIIDSNGNVINGYKEFISHADEN